MLEEPRHGEQQWLAAARLDASDGIIADARIQFYRRCVRGEFSR
jgi:hypothetical protein